MIDLSPLCRCLISFVFHAGPEPLRKDFVVQVAPSVDALKKMCNSVEGELQSLLAYFGEQPDSPDTPKPEDFFGLIVSFSSSLQVRECHFSVIDGA